MQLSGLCACAAFFLNFAAIFDVSFVIPEHLACSCFSMSSGEDSSSTTQKIPTYMLLMSDPQSFSLNLLGLRFIVNGCKPLFWPHLLAVKKFSERPRIVLYENSINNQCLSL